VLAKVIAEKQFVVPGALGAVGATARRGHKLRIALIEWRVFQNEQHVRLNPELQIAHRKQNPRRVLATVINFLETSRKRLFLLVCW
jgi:hypothetical protein